MQKKKKKKKKTLHHAVADFQLKKKEKRKKRKKEKKAETHGAKQTHGWPRSGQPPRPTARSRRPFSLVFSF
jgi:hypothetical protein